MEHRQVVLEMPQMTGGVHQLQRAQGEDTAVVVEATAKVEEVEEDQDAGNAARMVTSLASVQTLALVEEAEGLDVINAAKTGTSPVSVPMLALVEVAAVDPDAGNAAKTATSPVSVPMLALVEVAAVDPDAGNAAKMGTSPVSVLLPAAVEIVLKEFDVDKVFEQTGISSGINFDKYERIPVSLTGNEPTKHINQFEEAGLRPILLENVVRAGYKKPTPVQKYSIPVVKNGRDLMACAQTGSGKTAAFLLPIIHQLLEEGISGGAGEIPQQPACVIMSPTRELAIQIYQEAIKFCNRSVIRPAIAYGGAAVRSQLNKIMAGCHILVATPGRLKDFVGKGQVAFGNLRFFVLDEADRMLDMGFLPDINELMEHPSMPAKTQRQTLMFSATFPAEIQAMAAKFLNDYLYLTIGTVGAANTDVTQTFYEVERLQKRELLLEILNKEDLDKGKILIFVETKKNADFLASFLSQKNFPTTSIHGDRLQQEREQALGDFKSGKMPCLVATAVAARGLDIRGVSHVINYDMPKEIDEYIHRIGRTGRVGNTGKATSFFDPSNDGQLAAALLNVLGSAQQDVPDWLPPLANGGGGGGGFGGSRDARGGGGMASGGAVAAVEEDEW
ncbi:unnamed protein product [Cyprideis torosa]|uniref:RNA helicase n=1 Tax=Cyprideis torosa TaxID=163714 RepID=A0A7R8WHB9_9CRUS|nr:unnamed protein product [Cyprideis torosa]CAG0893106.1 unnamed protein product [Cyprideis torosa]